MPLVAVACAEREIPSTLACWCSGSDASSSGRGSGQAAAWSSQGSGPLAAPAASAGAAGAEAAAATAATNISPTEGSVRIVIMDESYHPRQLSLSKKVKDALRGTAALYAVDSSSVFAVNTGGGANKTLSPEEFRHAQVLHRWAREESKKMSASTG